MGPKNFCQQIHCILPHFILHPDRTETPGTQGTVGYCASPDAVFPNLDPSCCPQSNKSEIEVCLKSHTGITGMLRVCGRWKQNTFDCILSNLINIWRTMQPGRDQRELESPISQNIFLPGVVSLCINRKKEFWTVSITARGMREKRVKVDRVAKPLHRYFRYLGSAFISNTDHNRQGSHLDGPWHEIELFQHTVPTEKRWKRKKLNKQTKTIKSSDSCLPSKTMKELTAQWLLELPLWPQIRWWRYLGAVVTRWMEN